MGLAMKLAVNEGLGAFTAYGFRKWHASQVSFNGQWHDFMTGCYPLGHGHRSYSPVLMRFLSPDTLSPFAQGGGNAYAYCVGDPVNGDDPSGRVPRFIKVIGEVFFGVPSTAQRAEREALHRSQVLQQQKLEAGTQFSAFESRIDGSDPESKRVMRIGYLKHRLENSSQHTDARFTVVRETISLLQADALISDRSAVYPPFPEGILPAHADKLNNYRRAVLKSSAPGTSAKAKVSEVALQMAYANLKGDITKALNSNLERLRKT